MTVNVYVGSVLGAWIVKTGATQNIDLPRSDAVRANRPVIDVVQDYPGVWDWRLLLAHAAAAVTGLVLL